MGCNSCSTNGLPKGCKSNGSCGVNGCDKLTVFDWLSDMELPAGQQAFDFVEVRFKNGRKEFYKNVNNIALQMGDLVAVEGNPGHDIGSVSLSGELVRFQMKKKGEKPDSKDQKKLYRKANQKDIDTWEQAREKEENTMLRTRQIAQDLKLMMKVSDVEYQGDNTKATFYYTADDRVDFRELIKILASEFRIRIEMRQIGTRQEAGRVGGIGSCGRELCCTTWLTDFRSVNTAAARYQQLSLNPQKLAGQCGKLKCCLNYELDTYLEALKDFPDTQEKLQTQKGEATFQKMDIFRRKLWYAYDASNVDWIALSLNTVKEIMSMNQQGKKPDSLEEMVEELPSTTPNYENVVGQDSVSRFDHKNKKRRKKRPQKRRKKGNRSGTGKGES